MALFSILLVVGRPQYKALALLLSVHLIQEFLNPFEELRISHYLLTPALQLAFGPLYYLFVKNMIYGDIDLRRYAYHFIPTIVALALTRWWPIELMIAFVVLLIYIVLSIRLLRHYHKVLSETLSDGENHSLKWLTRTLMVIFVVEFVDFTRLNLQLLLNYKVLANWYFVSTLLSISCTAYLVLKAVRQPILFEGIAQLENVVATLPASDHDQELATTLFTAIDAQQRRTLAYRQPKYSLKNLAADMGLTEQNVSWALNRGGGKNFSDFINDLRLKDVKASLDDPNNTRNFLDIAYTAGFSSKSTFNAVFKKATGMTPSQYAAQDKV